MKSLFSAKRLAVLCLGLSVLTAAPVALAQDAKEPVVTVETEEQMQPAALAEKGALSPSQATGDKEQPLYAGTSTWFLLSIALLGSVAVQRRVDSPE